MGLVSRRGALALLAALPVSRLAKAETRPVRFGLTAVVVRENIDFFERWSVYLQRWTGRPVTFVQRRSYREIMELLETGELDFAWICGYPLVRHWAAGYLDLLAVPLFNGAPLYRSYVIVHERSPYHALADLEGKVFAYSDPDSNSGYLAPRMLMARQGLTPDRFFRLTLFTYSHAETVEAVAKHMADGGAVDSYVWEYLERNREGLTGRTRIIERSATFGFPPIVARRDGDPALAAAMRKALLRMPENEEGRRLLAALMLDGFAEADIDLFEDIAIMARDIAAISRI